MSRILYIDPIRVEGDFLEEDLAAAARPENSVDLVGFSRGPRHVEYHYYETLMLPDLVHTVMEAERLGYDAAVIGCFYDFGLQEGREVAERLIVTAPCEASCLLAASLGSTFSIIVGRRKWIPQMRNTVLAYGLQSRLASFRPLDLGVLDYHADAGNGDIFWLALKHLALPVFVLSLGSMAIIASTLRGDLLEVLNQDYVRTAHAKGLGEQRVLLVHTLRNAFIPSLTMIGLSFGWTLGGTVLVEVIFDWPGIGNYAVNAAGTLDFNPIMGVTLLVGVVFILINLAVDLLYGALDPRITYR